MTTTKITYIETALTDVKVGDRIGFCIGWYGEHTDEVVAIDDRGVHFCGGTYLAWCENEIVEVAA